MNKTIFWQKYLEIRFQNYRVRRTIKSLPENQLYINQDKTVIQLGWGKLRKTVDSLLLPEEAH